MGKESRLGVALIAVLLGVFGYVLYDRVKKKELASAAEQPDASEQPATEGAKPKLSSGPLKSAAAQPASSGTAKATDGLAAAPRSSGASARYGDPSGGDSRPTATGGASNDFRNASSTANNGSDNAARYGNRYDDRYGPASQQIYGPAASSTSDANMTERASPSTSIVSGQGDPFGRNGDRTTSGSRLTPTGDASAALLPPTATADGTATAAATDHQTPHVGATAKSSSTVPSSLDDVNPLRPSANSLAESNVGSPTNSSSDRYGPQKYDIYGSAGAATPSTIPPAAATNPAPRSRLNFSAAESSDRYATPGAGTTADRYSLSTNLASDTTTAPITNSSTGASTGSSSRTWSGNSSSSPTTGGTSSAGTSSSVTPSATASGLTAIPEKRTPRTMPAAAPVRGDTYIVQANDSFSTISEKVYGTSSYFKALHEHNKPRYPRPDLRARDIVATPPVEDLHRLYPSLCPKLEHVPRAGAATALTSQRGGSRVYVVEEGDTLFDIARFELGKASRWAEIYDLNRQVIGEDFNHLRPGTQLVLPSDHRDDNLTRLPGKLPPR